ncbi:MAG: NAD(P)-dependent oxidoreductase [Nitrospirae bacterium]|nr:NAD(P)-dependent oxidoreductase [Nitrospirota bacterium]
MKTAIVTGATGFIGHWLLKELVENDVFVYAICRRNSSRLSRLANLPNIEIIELDMEDIAQLPGYCSQADTFYHLAWEGGREDFLAQIKNIHCAALALQTAKTIGVKHFIMTGSQAEYGICFDRVDENHITNPITAYGVCKLSAYWTLKVLAEQISVLFTWVRIFSVYGNDDSNNKLLISYLVDCLQQNKEPGLTECGQLWDFLYAKDAANALYLLGIKEKTGVYNLASGESRILKDFLVEARDLLNPDIKLNFGTNGNCTQGALNVNVDKIKMATGWAPKTSFREGILKFKKSHAL